MGLFGKQNNERKEIKGQVKKLMNDYKNEKIDGATYIQKMMNLTTSNKKKNK